MKLDIRHSLMLLTCVDVPALNLARIILTLTLFAHICNLSMPAKTLWKCYIKALLLAATVYNYWIIVVSGVRITDFK